MPFSITNQLRYGIIATVMISITVTGGILISLSYQSQFDLLKSLEIESSRSTAVEIDSYIDDLQSKLSLLGRVSGFTDLDTDTQQHLIEGLSRHNTAYENVLVLNANGELVTSVSSYNLPFDIEDYRSAFKRAYQREEEYITLAEFDPVNHFTFVIMTVPLRDHEERVQGVLMAKVNLNYLNFVVSQAKVGRSGYAYILDNRFFIIAQKRTEFVNLEKQSDFNPSFLEHLVDAQIDTSKVYKGLYGTEVLGSFTLIPSVNWYAVVELPTDEVYAPINHMFSVAMLSLIISSAIALLVSMGLLRQIVIPLKRLTQAAAEIGEGRLDTIVEIKQRNELGLLGHTMNHLASRLNKTIKALQDDIYQRMQMEGALRKSEAKYRQLVDLAQEGIWAVDIEGKTTFVNPCMASILGYTVDEMLEKPFYSFVDQEAIPNTIANLERLKQGFREQHDFELLRKDGHRIYTSVGAAPIVDENGSVIGTLAVISDLTERKKTEQQKFALRLEQERVTILANFITQASHEFRTPLSIINTSLYLLSKAEDSETRQSRIKKIEEQIKYITNLVNTLTDMTNLDNTQKFEMSDVELCDVISTILTSHESITQAKDIQCRISCETPNIKVKGSLIHLQQAFDCIIDNALKFTPAHGTVSISLINQMNKVVIRVKDTGIGISTDDLHLIFDRFFRVDKSGTQRGFGIGLPMARRIIELHKGLIEVESEPGQGSTFTVSLPATS